MKGQVVLIIILIMATALGVGLAVVQRSLTDISSSTKVEESSRAFSAAEAGIERALRTGNSEGGILVGEASVNVNVQSNLPAGTNALEYPPIGKEEMAQVWLDPGYTNPDFNVYFGTPDTNDKPALEVTIITLSGGTYNATKKFFDSDSTRTTNNGFTDVSSSCTSNQMVRTNANTTDSKFYCMVNVSYSGTPVLARMRLLYSNTSQPLALEPTNGASLPAQAGIFTSTGTAGQTQRKVQLFKLDKVVPFYFDYALFSIGSIEK